MAFTTAMICRASSRVGATQRACRKVTVNWAVRKECIIDSLEVSVPRNLPDSTSSARKPPSCPSQTATGRSSFVVCCHSVPLQGQFSDATKCEIKIKVTHGSRSSNGSARSWILDGFEKFMSNTPLSRSGDLFTHSFHQPLRIQNKEKRSVQSQLFKAFDAK